jgi:hypothetical protein
MSNQNQYRNLFVEDEDINRATKLMWNRDYQEAIDAASIIWTRIMINSAPEMIFPKIKVLQIMIESTLSLTLSDLQYAEEWLETLTKLDYNGVLTRILKIKLAMRKGEEEEVIAKEYMDTLKGIEIIEDAIQRKDWLNQMEDLKKFYEEISGKTITIELPEVEIPNPENIRQTLFSHEDKPENVEVIRDEQDASTLHQEIKERLKILDNNMEKVQRMEQVRLKETKRMKRNLAKNKKKQKKVMETKKIDTSSDEYEKLSETEEEKEIEPPYNMNGESKEILRAEWKNEMETHEEKTIPRMERGR